MPLSSVSGRRYSLLLNGVAVAASMALLVLFIAEKPAFLQADIVKTNGRADTLQQFSAATVLGAGKIQIADPGTMMRYLAPRPVIDVPYASVLFVAIVLIVVFFHDFSYKHPFTRKALMGVRVGIALMFVFATANFFRYNWFNGQVGLLTGGQYAFARPFPLAAPEFWLLFILVRLEMVFRKGVELQKEADLTV